MRLLLINPNTTKSMTDLALSAARTQISADVEIIGATSSYGPKSIEGYYDEVFAIPPMLEQIRHFGDQIDGVVIACFDDTGVDAARTLVDVPVMGICQAAMQTASILANSFSVITTLGRSIPALEHLVVKYGYSHQCKNVRASEIPVLDLDKPGSKAEQIIGIEIEMALETDGAEAIVLGCAGMVDLAKRLSDQYAVPVIEGVAPAIKIIEGLATLGLKNSKRQGYARPRQKTYDGDFEKYSPEQIANQPK